MRIISCNIQIVNRKFLCRKIAFNSDLAGNSYFVCCCSNIFLIANNADDHEMGTYGRWVSSTFDVVCCSLPA